jgi:hypothetical protein
MPEPGYLDGDPPGLLGLILGTLVVAILFMLIKACVWG